MQFSDQILHSMLECGSCNWIWVILLPLQAQSQGQCLLQMLFDQSWGGGSSHRSFSGRAGLKSREVCEALFHNRFARLTSLHLVLQPQEHGAVLFLFVTVQVEIRNSGGELLHHCIQIFNGLHTEYVIENCVELVVQNSCRIRNMHLSHYCGTEPWIE